MKYTINTELELIEILKKHSFNYNFKILKREEGLYLPIQFEVKQNYNFYPCVFGFVSELFSENLFKELFSLNASHLEPLDKQNFIIVFAFQNQQIIS